MIRLAFFCALIFSFPAFADGQKVGVNISSCVAKESRCFSKGLHEFNAEDKVKVQAWFDAVKLDPKDNTKFFPLFNVYNYSEKIIEAEIGMQLLDINDKVLIEIKSPYSFKPTQKTEPSYETYISLGAQPLSPDMLKAAKFVRVVYENNSK